MSGSSFAERLESARDACCLSQSELASRLNMQPSSISHFESGRREPALKSLREIARALNVSADYLLGLTDRIVIIGNLQNADDQRDLALIQEAVARLTGGRVTP